MQQHKIRADSYSKAAATMKKQRKKKNNAQNADKEIKVNIHFYIVRQSEITEVEEKNEEPCTAISVDIISSQLCHFGTKFLTFPK